MTINRSTPKSKRNRNFEESNWIALNTKFQARATSDYSAKSAREISFKSGDVINVTKRDDKSGMWTGEIRGQIGLFPSNYVSIMN